MADPSLIPAFIEALLAAAPSYRPAPGQTFDPKPGWSIRGHRSAVIELR